MKLFQPDCVSCLFEQFKNGLISCKSGITTEEILHHQRELMRRLIDLPFTQFRHPFFGKIVYGLINEILNDPDPFKKEKIKFQNTGKKLYPKLKEMVKDSNNPLLKACVFSIMGNAIDLGVPAVIDIENDIQQITEEDLLINDFIEFEKDLNETETILIVGDNTGEIFFDKVLVEEILKIYPNKKIFFSVRTAPIINDATLEDAIFTGLDKICCVIESAPYPGMILEKSTPEFIDRFNTSDLIIMKGQGNFETSDNLKPKGSLYFFLKVKCPTIQKVLNIPIGGLVLKKKRN
ncbi:MAG: DUF89 family protein [Candidatus Lokiarchaeota archaeon]|nr:DUF89 family protein [Candidatus Lokiarchaeota archaeon]